MLITALPVAAPILPSSSIFLCTQPPRHRLRAVKAMVSGKWLAGPSFSLPSESASLLHCGLRIEVHIHVKVNLVRAKPGRLTAGFEELLDRHGARPVPQRIDFSPLMWSGPYISLRLCSCLGQHRLRLLLGHSSTSLHVRISRLVPSSRWPPSDSDFHVTNNIPLQYF